MQQDWIDAALWNWGAWVRRDRLPGYTRCCLERMIKGAMLDRGVSTENAEWDSEPDEQMAMAMDRAIASLGKTERRVLVLRYKYGHSVLEVVQRVRKTTSRNRDHYYKWMDAIKPKIAAMLRKTTTYCGFGPIRYYFLPTLLLSLNTI